LPDSLLHQIEPLLNRLEFDIPSRQYSIPNLELLIRCAAESRWVRVLYRSESRTRWLALLPIRIYTSHGFWYCEAYSQEHQEERTFRIDRMSEIEEADGAQAAGATGKASAGKADRSSARAVEEAVDHAAGKRASDETRMPASAKAGDDTHGNSRKLAAVAAGKHSSSGRPGKPALRKNEYVRIRARLTYRGALLAEQDKHFGHLVRQIGDEEWLLDFMCPLSEWRWTVKFFYSLALDAEVLEPNQLREEIRLMADEVRARYDRVPEHDS